ncbi:MAG TPA: Lrp/AsnC family transcriptional regulator [Streptosporangiaceae bacterium]
MLDAVDAALIQELQLDGRATFQTLGDRVGMSRTAVRARVRRLLDTGALRVVGVINAEVLGIGARALVSIGVEGPAAVLMGELSRRDAVTFAALVAGRHAIVAEVRARDDGELAAELDDIRLHARLRAMDVFRCVRVVKAGGGAAVPAALHAGLTLDDTDWRLMRELQRDGRAPYARLARFVGLSQAATRARVVRLIEACAVQVTGVVDAAAAGTDESAGLGLRVRGDVATCAEKIAGLVGTETVLTGYGRYDIVAVLNAEDRARLLNRIETVRAVPEVRAAESWHHLAVSRPVRRSDTEAAASA